MSIQPRFANAIVAGDKPYELRRMRPRFGEGDRVIIYASRTIGRVIGTFVVGEIFSGAIDDVWHRLCSRHDGPPLSQSGFFAYLANASVVSAIEIRNPHRLAVPLPLGFRAPQSYQFLKDDNASHRQLLQALPESQ